MTMASQVPEVTAMTREELAERDPDLLLLVSREGMTDDDAVEWMEFNVVGAYAGNRTPWFLHRA